MRGAVLAALLLGACAPPAPAQVEVVIDERVYVPAEVEIGLGATVTWRNGDALLHSVWFDGSADKGWVREGETFERAFADPGTYAYHCVIHPVSMSGTVTVAG